MISNAMKHMKKVMLTALVPLFLVSCTPSMNFLTSSVVPAATGKVHVKRDKNANYQIKVDVENLAPADRLTPPQRNYVVWMESDRNTIKKLGLIEPSSKNLKASLNATVVADPNRVFITAENSPEAQYPGGTEVLATQRR